MGFPLSQHTGHQLTAADGHVLYSCKENHQTRNTILLSEPVVTDAVYLEVLETHSAPAALFELGCYEVLRLVSGESFEAGSHDRRAGVGAAGGYAEDRERIAYPDKGEEVWSDGVLVRYFYVATRAYSIW